MRFDGKHAVIIGGSSGIGLATARLALAEGGSVTIAGRSADRLAQAAAELAGGDRVRTTVADIADDASVAALFAAEDRIDSIFLPAGELVAGGANLLTVDPAGLREALEVRLLGPARVLRAARPKLAADGSVVLMSGLYASRPAPGFSAGAAAVAAVEGMARGLALDLAPIRVNAIAPGIIVTPLWDAFGPAGREMADEWGKKLPVGRAGRVEEAAEAVLLLMTNGFISGTILAIDGGGALV